ncbi:hypothetical protein CVT26_013083 [Gymnopilus dilepis]|uniref:Uncharacterized protein n=1 Tax=Gymnopilus dilepis TaxID=231916 RepID=A0A409Y4J2_9AGAR|nr:hypothetical protein CVT26_013083 [Gymnopilus dilepis]
MSDLQDVGQKIKKCFKWDRSPHSPHEFQFDAIIKAQLLRKDVLVHARRHWSGEDIHPFIAAGPHAHESAKGKVTFMVTLLIALQEEQVKTFQEKYKREATAVNSSHGGCTKEVIADICQGKW